MRVRAAAGVIGGAVVVAAALAFRRPAPSVALHRWLCAALRLRLRRFGAPGPERRLIVANHVSWLDVLALGAMEPMTFLAKKEVGANRWTRALVERQGVVYVDRERKRCIPEVNARMARRMGAGAPVALFAESTTSDGTRLLRFRSSHFEAARLAGACVQPVYLDYRRVGGIAAARADRAIVAWYGDMAFLPSLWRVLGCGGVHCDIHYGEPIAVKDAANRKALARQVEAAIRGMKQRARRGIVP